MDTFDYDQIAWSGPICLKRDSLRNVIQFEAWAAIHGESRCVRSFTLRIGRLDPGALRILEAAISRRLAAQDKP